MNNAETSLVKVHLFNVVNHRHCPQCGGQRLQSNANLPPGRFEPMWAQGESP